MVPVLTALYYIILNANSKRFVEYYYGHSFVKPFPFHTYPDISSICLRILRRFSKEMLCTCRTRNSQKLGPSGRIRPPEACFQDEFYRCFWEETGSDIGISSEWCGSSKGRIDFLISQVGWGFELLRDASRLEEHCGRFKPGGQYHPWIQQGLLKDWLILDFRHSWPRTPCKPIEGPFLPSSRSMIANNFFSSRTAETVESDFYSRILEYACVGL